MTLRPALRFGAAAAVGLLALGVLAADIEVLVVLALLMLLVLRETAGRALSAQERTRVDFLIAAGFVAFAVVVVRRVAGILSA